MKDLIEATFIMLKKPYILTTLLLAIAIKIYYPKCKFVKR